MINLFQAQYDEIQNRTKYTTINEEDKQSLLEGSSTEMETDKTKMTDLSPDPDTFNNNNHEDWSPGDVLL